MTLFYKVIYIIAKIITEAENTQKVMKKES